MCHKRPVPDKRPPRQLSLGEPASDLREYFDLAFEHVEKTEAAITRVVAVHAPVEVCTSDTPRCGSCHFISHESRS